MNASEPLNTLLRRLSQPQLQSILKEAEFVHVDVNETIIEPLQSIKFVDFPETGVISIVTMVDKKMVEIANVGREGFIGVPIVLEVERTSQKAFCQIEASAWRIPGDHFRNFLKENLEFRHLCLNYVATFLNQIAVNSSCNWVHSIEERCARWMLMAHDRVLGDEFVLTQETLSSMLGIRRAGVNLAAGELANAGLIKYVRGKITILNRNGLEEVTCKCYESMRAYFDQTFGV